MVAARAANLKRGGDRRSEDFKAPHGALKSEEDGNDTPQLVSTKRAAALMKVGERTVDRAKRVIESNNQDVIKEVDTGQLTRWCVRWFPAADFLALSDEVEVLPA
jgi:hypothetical protein